MYGERKLQPCEELPKPKPKSKAQSKADVQALIATCFALAGGIK